eukprot:Gb_23621 [translate_table: standard]
MGAHLRQIPTHHTGRYPGRVLSTRAQLRSGDHGYITSFFRTTMRTSTWMGGISMETITIGDKRIGIKTSVLEEKATACNMLCCYADELKEGFYPWIDQVAPTLVPLLKFYFHEEVRKAAVSAMPELLRCAKLAVEKGQAQGRDETYIKQLSDYIIPTLVEALHKEPETEICSTMLNALNECMQISGLLLNQSQVKSIVEELKQVLTASGSRKRERAERTKAEDFDAEEEEILEEENEQEDEVFDQSVPEDVNYCNQLMRCCWHRPNWCFTYTLIIWKNDIKDLISLQVGECIGTLIKTFKSSFLPFFDELFSYLTPIYVIFSVRKELKQGRGRETRWSKYGYCRSIHEPKRSNYRGDYFHYGAVFKDAPGSPTTKKEKDKKEKKRKKKGFCQAMLVRESILPCVIYVFPVLPPSRWVWSVLANYRLQGATPSEPGLLLCIQRSSIVGFWL